MINKIYKSVEELSVWLKSYQLTLKIYSLTKSFPKDEMYALTSQIRRSSSSIGANITEGYARNSTKELLQFLYNARGSSAETLYHLKLALDLKYLKKSDYENLKEGYNEVGKQLNGWISSLKKRLAISH